MLQLSWRRKVHSTETMVILQNMNSNFGPLSSKKNPASQAPGMGGAGGSKKATIGLALVGGAYPAAIVGSGIMRGFQRKTILIDGEERPALEGFDYTTGISGGNFPSVLYAFAPGTTGHELFDADGIGHPSEITKEYLENIPPSSIFSFFTESILAAFVHAILSAALFGDTFWESFVHKTFLEPFGISRSQPIGKTRDEVKATPIVMTSVVGPVELHPEYSLNRMSRKYMKNLMENANLFKVPEEFPEFTSTDAEGNFLDSEAIRTLFFRQAINYNRTGETLWELAKLSSFQIPYGAYISPDEFAIPMEAHRATYEDADGNVTADYIDFLPVSAHPDDVEPQLFSHWKLPSTKFSLTKMLAAGTDLLVMAAPLIPEQLKPLAFRPISVELPTADGSKREMALSDGGFNGYNGIPSLVQKGCKKIIINLYSTKNRINDGLSRIFFTDISFFSQYFGVMDTIRSNFNQLFDLYSNNENQVMKFYSNIESLYNAGEPLITTLKGLDVVDNKFWGIKGGGKVDLTVIMNIGVPKKFSDQVPRDVAPPPEGMNFTDRHGFFTNPDLKDVPNMKMFHDPIEMNIPALNISQTLPLPEFATPTKETRMTEILCSWMIEHAWEGLVGDDGEVKFEGFKNIFEAE